MNLVPGVQRITANGSIGPAAVTGLTPRPIRLFAVCLVSGGSASSLILRDGTSAAATANAQIDGVASQGVTVNFAGGLRFPNGLFASVDANINYATFSFTDEY